MQNAINNLGQTISFTKIQDAKALTAQTYFVRICHNFHDCMKCKSLKYDFKITNTLF